MKSSIVPTSCFLLLLTASANAASLRGNDGDRTRSGVAGKTEKTRQLQSDYVNPLEWLEEKSQNKNNGLSCVIREANVPDARGRILTADGGEVALEDRRSNLDHQRWVIYNQQNFEFGFTNGPTFNIFNTDNHNKPYLSTDFYGNTDMHDKDDASGRQRWRFNRQHNPTIRYDHQTGITVAGGVGNRYGGFGAVPTRLANWGGDQRHVQLVRQDDIGSFNYEPVTWELIDCYQVESPDN